jgi:hypothetical protein
MGAIHPSEVKRMLHDILWNGLRKDLKDNQLLYNAFKFLYVGFFCCSWCYLGSLSRIWFGLLLFLNPFTKNLNVLDVDNMDTIREDVV